MLRISQVWGSIKRYLWRLAECLWGLIMWDMLEFLGFLSLLGFLGFLGSWGTWGSWGPGNHMARNLQELFNKFHNLLHSIQKLPIKFVTDNLASLFQSKFLILAKVVVSRIVEGLCNMGLISGNLIVVLGGPGGPGSHRVQKL